MLKPICAEIESQILQIGDSPQQQAAIAVALLAVGRQQRDAEPGTTDPLHDLFWRLAWLIYILAPSVDESFIVTMPMRLEMIAEGHLALRTVLDDLRAADLEAEPERSELAARVAYQIRLPSAPATLLRSHVVAAVRALRSDPGVLDRVIESIARESEPPWVGVQEELDAALTLSLGLPRSRRNGLD
jgi:hypothetical protein